MAGWLAKFDLSTKIKKIALFPKKYRKFVLKRCYLKRKDQFLFFKERKESSDTLHLDANFVIYRYPVSKIDTKLGTLNSPFYGNLKKYTCNLKAPKMPKY